MFRMSKAVLAAAMIAAMTLPAATVQAEPLVYPYDLMKDDARARAAFLALTEPVSKDFSWIKDYGTSVPVETFELAGDAFHVVSGCKPHNCSAERYVVLIDKKTGTAYGGVLRNEGDASAWQRSEILWLGAPQDEFAKAIIGYLFS